MLLVSGRFSLSKTIIPEAQEHFLTPSAHRDTHIFGGLGLSLSFSTAAGPGDQSNKVAAFPKICHQMDTEPPSWMNNDGLDSRKP